MATRSMKYGDVVERLAEQAPSLGYKGLSGAVRKTADNAGYTVLQRRQLEIDITAKLVSSGDVCMAAHFLKESGLTILNLDATTRDVMKIDLERQPQRIADEAYGRGVKARK